MRSEAGHSMRLRQVVQSLSTPPLTLCCSMRVASAHREPIFFRVLTDAGFNPFTFIETETLFHESHTNDVAVASIHFSNSEARWFRLQDVEMPLLATIVFNNTSIVNAVPFIPVVSSFLLECYHCVYCLDSWSLCRRRLPTFGYIERGRPKAVGKSC